MGGPRVCNESLTPWHLFAKIMGRKGISSKCSENAGFTQNLICKYRLPRLTNPFSCDCDAGKNHLKVRRPFRSKFDTIAGSKGFMNNQVTTVDVSEILHQLSLVVSPMIYRVSYIPGGAGFLPATFL